MKPFRGKKYGVCNQGNGWYVAGIDEHGTHRAPAAYERFTRTLEQCNRHAMELEVNDEPIMGSGRCGYDDENEN